MKALWITYDIVLDDEITRMLEDCGITGFTRWPRLTGRGPGSGARLDSHIWPGANAAVMTVQEDDVIKRIMVSLQALRDEVGAKTGVWAFTSPVLEQLQG